jgi:hypothetical protein
MSLIVSFAFILFLLNTKKRLEQDIFHFYKEKSSNSKHFGQQLGHVERDRAAFESNRAERGKQ